MRHSLIPEAVAVIAAVCAVAFTAQPVTAIIVIPLAAFVLRRHVVWARRQRRLQS